MLKNTEEMMSYTFESLAKKGKVKKAQENIYNKDKYINILERDIRKRILIHMSANPKSNITACLLLICISKDAERLGDYIKNLSELPHLLKDAKSDKKLFQKLFNETGSELLKLIQMSTDSFKNSDKILASKAIELGHEIAQKCEDIIEEVVESDFKNRQVVVLALGARYMKRISLHLSNISSSVVNPLPEIDFKISARD